jgi:hypothetical protein
VIGKLVLFGGASNGDEPLADTWIYDGTTWTQASPATSPPARSAASMTYDSSTGKIVLFGGDNGIGSTDPLGCPSGQFGDTWTYNGTTWAYQPSAVSPPAREDASMAYDPDIGEAVLFGGEAFDEGGDCLLSIFHPTIYSDTWAYQDGTWSKTSPTVSPAAPFIAGGYPTAFDSAYNQLVLCIGETTQQMPYATQTWAYQPEGSGYWLVASDGVCSASAPHFLAQRVACTSMYPSSAWLRPRTAKDIRWSARTAECSASAPRSFTARPATCTSPNRSWVSASRARGGAAAYPPRYGHTPVGRHRLPAAKLADEGPRPSASVGSPNASVKSKDIDGWMVKMLR